MKEGQRAVSVVRALREVARVLTGARMLCDDVQSASDDRVPVEHDALDALQATLSLALHRLDALTHVIAGETDAGEYWTPDVAARSSARGTLEADDGDVVLVARSPTRRERAAR